MVNKTLEKCSNFMCPHALFLQARSHIMSVINLHLQARRFGQQEVLSQLLINVYKLVYITFIKPGGSL